MTLTKGTKVSFGTETGVVWSGPFGYGAQFVDVRWDKDQTFDVTMPASLLTVVEVPKMKFTDADFPVGATFTSEYWSFRKAETTWEFKINQGGQYVPVDYSSMTRWVGDGTADWDYEVVVPQTRNKIKYSEANWEV